QPRLFELRVLADPAPTVNLERPAPQRDTLTMLPGADFLLQGTAEDNIYALRSAFVEYRTKRGEPVRRLLLYDHQLAALGLSQTLMSLGQVPLQRGPSLRLRVQWLPVTRRLSLKEFRHRDGGELQ